jgi:hypothetical protein
MKDGVTIGLDRMKGDIIDVEDFETIYKTLFGREINAKSLFITTELARLGLEFTGPQKKYKEIHCRSDFKIPEEMLSFDWHATLERYDLHGKYHEKYWLKDVPGWGLRPDQLPPPPVPKRQKLGFRNPQASITSHENGGFAHPSKVGVVDRLTVRQSQNESRREIRGLSVTATENALYESKKKIAILQQEKTALINTAVLVNTYLIFLL